MDPGKILMAQQSGTYVIRLTGDVRLTLSSSLEQCFDGMLSDADFKTVLVDVRSAQCVDSTTLGLLAKLSLLVQQRFDTVPSIVSTNPDITKILVSMGFKDQIFIILTQLPAGDVIEAHEVPEQPCSAEQTQARVLEAHRVLMDLNESNTQQFKDLVAALEQAKSSD